jgi:hypothetical protein
MAGRRSVKTPPPPTHADTLRLDFLAKTRFWLLFNEQQQAWAVMGSDNKPINARITVRDAIDAARVTKNG